MLKAKDTYDIIFEASEDLYSLSKTQVLLLKNSCKIISIAKPRQFQSYCYEFCGIVGLTYSSLRFLIGGRDVNPDICIMSNCHVKILHTSESQPPATKLAKNIILDAFQLWHLQRCDFEGWEGIDQSS